MRHPVEALKRLRGEKLAAWTGRLVRIWSDEHGAWWRPDAAGYVDDVLGAGVYVFEDAMAHTGHCGREKKIRLEKVTPAEERFRREAERLSTLLNTPEVADFVQGVMREVPHQRERWGADHDTGKSALDWFWLIGFLAQKIVVALAQGDQEKALHHCISTAATLANWHAGISGASTTMRPGIDAPEARRP
jgi:hypothetical protein